MKKRRGEEEKRRTSCLFLWQAGDHYNPTRWSLMCGDSSRSIPHKAREGGEVRRAEEACSFVLVCSVYF